MTVAAERPPVESGLLVAPQLTTLASWGELPRRLAVHEL